ncbi:hypothetical protein KML24007_12210 [Alistipes indistinctus]
MKGFPAVARKGEKKFRRRAKKTNPSDFSGEFPPVAERPPPPGAPFPGHSALREGSVSAPFPQPSGCPNHPCGRHQPNSPSLPVRPEYLNDVKNPNRPNYRTYPNDLNHPNPDSDKTAKPQKDPYR